MIQHIFSDNLIRFCDEKQITVEELAEKIGKSPRQVIRYRNYQCDNITLETVSKIAEVLNIHITALLHQDDQ